MPKKRWLQFVLAVVSMALIIKYFWTNVTELEKIRRVNPSHIFLILLSVLWIHLVNSYKAFIFLKKSRLHSMSFGSWFKIFTISRFINFHITQGANVYRGIVLKRDYDFSYTKSIGVMTFLGWAELCFIFFVACFLLMIVNPNFILSGMNVLPLLFVVFVGLIALPFAANSLVVALRPGVGNLRWLHGKLVELSQHIVDGIKNHVMVGKLFILFIVSFAFYVLAIYVAFHAIGIQLGFDATIVFTVLILLNSVINITPNNIGVMELLYGGLTDLLGWNLGDGILVCGIIRILTYILTACIAMVWCKDIFREMT